MHLVARLHGRGRGFLARSVLVEDDGFDGGKIATIRDKLMPYTTEVTPCKHNFHVQFGPFKV